MIAYTGLCTFENALGTITVINGALCLKAREIGKVLPTFVRNKEEGTNPGAFVAEPKGGFQEQFAYFDASSLYPNTIITLNMSPETKVGKLVQTDNGFTLQHVSGKNYDLTEDKLKTLVNKEQLCLTKADILYTQKFKGIVPIFLEDLYNKRQAIRAEMQSKKKELSKIKGDKSAESLEKQKQLQLTNWSVR
jgi:DNA polymerase elongation subunit (family B)